MFKIIYIMINYYDFVANIVLVYTYTYTHMWHTHWEWNLMNYNWA